MPAMAVTKTNLLRLKEELSFATLGHELLDQKRNILILELMHLVDQTVDQQQKMEKAFSQAYISMENAVLQMGKVKLLHLANAVHITADINIKSRRVMGISLPAIETSFNEYSPHFTPEGTSPWIEESLEKFKEVLHMMGRMAELKISVLRLAAEVRKTIRKVNALEKIAIPDLQHNVSTISARLEENERDMLILMKKVRQRLIDKKNSIHFKKELP